MPRLLKDINYVFTEKVINIASQFLQTDTEIEYVIIDAESQTGEVILQELKDIPHTIRARMLY
jgi:D-3-phosphoglycerate dehydrogenase